MQCKACGERLDFRRRSDAKFCDATCRKRYSRRGDAAQRAYNNILRDCQTIRRTIKQYPDLRADLNQQLKRLRAEITDILRLSDRDTIQEQAEKFDLISNWRNRP